MRQVAALGLALAVFASAKTGARTGPRLAVVIAVDGLSWERLEAARPWLHAGLARLLDEGAVATECRYGHLNTLTAPGHASLSTGAPPRVHGIPVNQWYVPSPDGLSMLPVYAASQPVASHAENAPEVVLGAGRLRVPTLGDRLVGRDPRSKVISIANKDRAAIFLAGRDPRHQVYWYDGGTYVTSDAYRSRSSGGAAAAGVVARFNAKKAGAQLTARFGTTWSRLPVARALSNRGFATGLTADQYPYIGPRFPHELTSAGRLMSESILWTPFADQLLVDLALELMADPVLALGRDDAPDMLALSFSASDFVSHDYGPDSVEELEVLRGLDTSLGRLLDAISARVGKERVLIALSADHGFLPLANLSRVAEDAWMESLNAAVNTQLKRVSGAPPVHHHSGCSVWLDRTVLSAPGDAAKALAIVQRELAGPWKDAIERTFAVDAAAPPGTGDPLAEKAWDSRVPGRSGDLFVVPRFGVLIDSNAGKGTTHGSPWEYDAHVPLIFWGGGIARQRVSAKTTPYDLVPTMAAWLGLTLPDATGTRLKVRR